VRRAGAFTQSELTAAFKAGRAAGVRVVYEVRPDGTKRLETFPLGANEDPSPANDIDDAIDRGKW
jgi:hypothetical protein